MRQLIAFIAFVFIFSSCANHSKNEMIVFKAIEEGLSNANTRITWQTDNLYKSLENKLAEPATHEQALFWQPKTESIRQLSSAMVKYIEDLKSDLIKEAGFKEENGKNVPREDNMGAVAPIFSEKKKGKELYEKLVKYKDDMLAVDEQIKNEFQNHIILITKSYDADSSQQKDLTKSFFTDIPLIAALAMLNKIENNVKIMESDFVMYCNSRIANDIDRYDRFSPIIAQSSNYVKGGDEIEINAGIGSFTTAWAPRITINNKIIDLNADAVATYKFKTSLKAGKYFMPVKIEYTRPDGTKGYFTKNITYTVEE